MLRGVPWTLKKGRDEFGQQAKALRPCLHLMGLSLGEDGDDTGLIDKPGSAAQADAASGGDLVKLRLGGVSVDPDGFPRGIAHRSPGR